MDKLMLAFKIWHYLIGCVKLSFYEVGDKGSQMMSDYVHMYRFFMVDSWLGRR